MAITGIFTARSINTDGTINGDDFAISSNFGIRQRDPAIAFDPANHLFSVVWEHGDPDPENIYGQICHDPAGHR